MSTNALESAINVALAHYRRAGRADIRKQEVGRTFGGAFRSRAPVILEHQGDT